MGNKISGTPDIPRVLFLDIETAPNLTYTWGLYDQQIGINQIKLHGYVLCWAAKWKGENRILSDSITNYPAYYKARPTCDKKIALSMQKLLNEAHIVVTHNGDSFDLKWLNTLFVKHKLGPAAKYKSIDTYKIAKYNFRFVSNKLENICTELSLGHKLKHEGFELWEKCLRGNKKAWSTMIKYCKHDVRLLEHVYDEFKPYIKNHPRVQVYKTVDKRACPSCGSKNVVGQGFLYTATGKFQRYQCKKCGKWSRDRRNLLTRSKEDLVNE